MARDRQRAKQRRRRQSDGGPAARPHDPLTGDAAQADQDREPVGPDRLDAARDAGVEDVLDERGAPGTTPAPDPLKHSSPYVDEAKLAEAGAELDPPPGATATPAPEQLEYPAESARSSGTDDRSEGEVARPSGSRALTFLRHSAEELKRVQWPDRRQTGQGTAVVLGFVVLAGGYLGLMDAIWKPIIEAII